MAACLYVEETQVHNCNCTAMQSFSQDAWEVPAQAKTDFIDGMIIAKFIVDELGAGSSVIVIDALAAGCDDEVVYLLGKLPLFRPGKQAGRAEKVKLTVPVSFRSVGEFFQILRQNDSIVGFKMP